MNGVCIGKKIKELRTQAGFSQETIANYLHVDQSLISKIEQGDREVSTDIIKKLSELFGCSVKAFIENHNYKQSLKVAFRSSKLTEKDLKSIAAINRIALNLEIMQQLLGED